MGHKTVFIFYCHFHSNYHFHQYTINANKTCTLDFLFDKVRPKNHELFYIN